VKGAGASEGELVRRGGGLVLGIETSCDETAAAVVEDGRTVRSNVVASQVDLHARYGGVVPEIASRRHVELVMPVVDEALRRAGAGLGDLSGIAATRGPGLVGSLLVGLSAGKALALASGVPFVAVNHLEGHVYANFLGRDPGPWPSIALVVSGGHSDLLLFEGHGSFRVLGRTRDDAAGEAFDKIARVLELGYPGGPAIDGTARGGDPDAIRFPRAYLEDGSFDFSFSGLKTAVIVYMDRERAEGRPPDLRDVCAGFQEAVVDVLVDKAVSAAKTTGSRVILLAGGVAANSRLRERFDRASEVEGVRVIRPEPALCTDNAAMIACAGHYRLERGLRSPLDVPADPNLGWD